ncbi:MULTISPECIES: ABC transporter ATP-binding protein [Clostridiaceae]|uniref:ABC transporter ATP-binding protein n=1 Tax=Clostridium facile TaxID=2763035 RepID=A0ABR7IUF1_9CLOT|nr:MULTISPECIES: ABC transporter ATP-binding protein [Clostridiaceae]MBC5788502.1 ABC transporter ATP-binding protein [Clostridium facile]PWM99825.1 MAG: macrolide ABC transporter ATP-binding protein [Massilioclostridium sp.]
MLIELQEATKIYPMGEETICAMDHISFGIQKGEFVSIIGCSGSGKSTLMNILGCLDTLNSGKYFLDGEDVACFTQNRLSKIRNEKIGFVFQSFYLIPNLTALENVELPLKYQNIPKHRRKLLAASALHQVGLNTRMHHRPNQLSGGQQQRVAIARAIASSPPIILADEPTGNLDSKSGNDIMEILQILHNEGKTILLITHDPAIANQAQRTLKIADGKLVDLSV